MYDVDIYFYPCDAKMDYAIEFAGSSEDSRDFRSDPRDQALGSDGNGMCQSMLNGVDIEYNGLKAGILGGELYSLLSTRVDLIPGSFSIVPQRRGSRVRTSSSTSGLIRATLARPSRSWMGCSFNIALRRAHASLIRKSSVFMLHGATLVPFYALFRASPFFSEREK